MYFFVFAAAVIALGFVAAAMQRPRPAAHLAAVLWAAYAVYEYYVANGTLCDANCNIRVDLLLFFPLLGWATYIALRKNTGNGAVAALAVVCLALVALLAAVFGNNALSVVAGVGALIIAVFGVRSIRKTKQA